MDISTAPGSGSVVSEQDKEDTAATAPSFHTSIRPDVNENDLQEPANRSQRVDKGGGRDQKKHGVMSLPAEIRERCAFQSSRLGSYSP